MKFQRLTFILAIIFSNSFTYAQRFGGGEANPKLRTNKEALSHFQDNRFGMFLHWGPVTLRGVEIGWSRGTAVPIADYDELYKEFNPVLFDADAWIKTVKAAGMKYIVITTKHHDGFCLWDSKFTDYDIMSTPYKKDIVKELAVACKKYGVDFGIYYSLADWHHPDYATRYGGDPRPVKSSEMSRYITYMKNQLKELIENYDPTLIWFDGGWEECYTHEIGMDLYAYLRNLKSNLIINDRIDKAITGIEEKKYDNPEKYAGDYETPEQRIGAYNVNEPWETCMTICQQWSWKPNDTMKGLETSLLTLSKVAGGGGNLLYNVGPMPDGRFEKRQTDMLLEMGKWLDKNGEAIYKTQGGPYEPTSDFVSTRKGSKIYLHILKKDLTNIILPILEKVKINKIVRLDDGKSISFDIVGNTLKFHLASSIKIPYVVEIEINTDTKELKTIRRNLY